jgi:hypothetical protein
MQLTAGASPPPWSGSNEALISTAACHEGALGIYCGGVRTAVFMNAHMSSLLLKALKLTAVAMYPVEFVVRGEHKQWKDGTRPRCKHSLTVPSLSCLEFWSTQSSHGVVGHPNLQIALKLQRLRLARASILHRLS